MKSIKYFSEDEIQKFFKVVKKDKNVRNLLLFKWLYRYGCRINEIAKLQLNDIKPDSRHPLEIHIRRLKGGQSRHYPIHPDDSKLIARWMRKRSQYDNSQGNPFLFITKRSVASHLTDSLIKALHKKYSILADLPKEKSTNPHVWRHSCAISLLLNGKDIFFVKSYLGHSSIQSTLVYAKIAPPEWKKLSKDAVLNSFSI